MVKWLWIFKRFFLLLLLLLSAGIIYTLIVNRSSMNMTPKQKVLKAAYPLISRFQHVFGSKKEMAMNEKNIAPATSFYDLSIPLNNGEQLDFSSLKGKKVLLVNTASHCGYTGQYAPLQRMYEDHQPGLVVIGFPANDFKEQEKGSDEEIASFCKVNYGVSFPLAKKASVIGDEQQPVYQWLTDATKNGWNNQEPTWNFCKYIIDEEGRLTHFFPVTVAPDSKEIKEALGYHR